MFTEPPEPSETLGYWQQRAEQAERQRDDARRWAVRLEQLMFSERDAAYSLLLRSISSKPLFSGTT